MANARFLFIISEPTLNQTMMTMKRNIKGLTPEQVLESRAKYGQNILTPTDKVSVWKRFIEKFKDPLIIIRVPREKRLSFLSDALSGIDKEELAKQLEIGSSTFYYWFSHDDIFISYIYRIAEKIGKKVKVEIRPK